jgi:glutamyl-tRNA reductase
VDRLVLIGVSHRRGGAVALEAWQDNFDVPSLGRLGFDAFVVIATCNRWEVILILPEGVDVDSARRMLTVPGYKRPYAFIGEAAVEHLALVATSIDSLNPGEDQIIGQVREAYREAKERGVMNGALAFAMETALRVAKGVRNDVELAPTHTSLFSLARPEIEKSLAPGSAAAVLGAGEMGSLATKVLAGLEGIRVTLFNRTQERAVKASESLGITVRELADFPKACADITVLVCATPVRDLVTARSLASLPNLKLIVDLGLPRNVESGAVTTWGIQVLDVDTLRSSGTQRREVLREELALAEGLVMERLAKAMAAWNERQATPSIRRLQDWIGETIESTISELDPEVVLSQEERERLVRRVSHVPIKGLRGLAREYGPEAARIFLAESGLAEE